MNPVRLVLFDVTGTLLRPAPSVASQYAMAAVKYLGLPAEKLPLASQCFNKSFVSIYKSYRHKYPCFGALHDMPSRTWWYNVFAKCMLDCSRQLQIPSPNDQKLHEAFGDVYINFTWNATPHAPEVLMALKSLHSVDGSYVRLAAVSNSDNRTSIALSQKGLLQFFETVVTSEEAKCEKPDPRIFDFTLNKLSLSSIARNEVLYIGDSYEKDYIAPRTAGFQALLVTSEEYPIKKNHQLSNLMQVLDFVALSNR